MHQKYKFSIFKQFSQVFYQTTAEFYDNHILLTMICIFWPEFGLKPRYVALHLTENEIFVKTLVPLSYEIILTVYIGRWDIKQQ